MADFKNTHKWQNETMDALGVFVADRVDALEAAVRADGGDNPIRERNIALAFVFAAVYSAFVQAQAKPGADALKITAVTASLMLEAVAAVAKIDVANVMPTVPKEMQN